MPNMTNDDQFEHGRIPLKPLPYSNRELASTNEFIIDYDGENASYHMYISDSNDPSVLIDLTQKIISEILPNARINANQFQITIEGIEDPTSLQDILNFIYKRFTYANNPNGFDYERDIAKVMDPTTKTVLLQNTDGTILLPVTTADAIIDTTGISIQQRLDNMTRLGFSVDYLRATEHNQVQFTITYPFKNYSDFIEVRIGTVIVDKTRYAIIPDRDSNGEYTTATLTFVDTGHGTERIEVGRRIDILFIYNALANTGGSYEYMYGGNIADGSITTAKLEKVSDSYVLDDPTSLATSKALRRLTDDIITTLITNTGPIRWAADSSDDHSIIDITNDSYPADMLDEENIPLIFYILLKTDKVAGASLKIGSVANSWNKVAIIYNSDFSSSAQTPFSAGSILKIMWVRDPTYSFYLATPILLDTAVVNTRTRYSHLCLDAETTISFSGLSYELGEIIDVYRNGVRLFEDIDYSIDFEAKTITLFVRTEDGERIIFEAKKG